MRDKIRGIGDNEKGLSSVNALLDGEAVLIVGVVSAESECASTEGFICLENGAASSSRGGVAGSLLPVTATPKPFHANLDRVVQRC